MKGGKELRGRERYGRVSVFSLPLHWWYCAGWGEGYEVKESVVEIVCFFRSFIMMTV